MPSDQPRDYAVGYGKPPRRSRFTKGHSGNPRGRPRGAKNLLTLLNEVLNERVIVADNGGRRKITKGEAIITQLVNQAAKGDWRRAKLVVDMQQQDIERRTDSAPPEAADLGEADKKVIEQLKARLNRNKGKSDD
jgi:hypothetical protein